MSKGSRRNCLKALGEAWRGAGGPRWGRGHAPVRPEPTCHGGKEPPSPFPSSSRHRPGPPMPCTTCYQVAECMHPPITTGSPLHVSCRFTAHRSALLFRAPRRQLRNSVAVRPHQRLAGHCAAGCSGPHPPWSRCSLCRLGRPRRWDGPNCSAPGKSRVGSTAHGGVMGTVSSQALRARGAALCADLPPAVL